MRAVLASILSFSILMTTPIPLKAQPQEAKVAKVEAVMHSIRTDLNRYLDFSETDSQTISLMAEPLGDRIYFAVSTLKAKEARVVLKGLEESIDLYLSTHRDLNLGYKLKVLGATLLSKIDAEKRAKLAMNLKEFLPLTFLTGAMALVVHDKTETSLVAPASAETVQLIFNIALLTGIFALVAQGARTYVVDSRHKKLRTHIDEIFNPYEDCTMALSQIVK